MDFIEYSNSAFWVFDFSGPDVRIFNRKKKQISYLLLSLNLYLLVKSVLMPGTTTPSVDFVSSSLLKFSVGPSLKLIERVAKIATVSTC